MTTVDLLERGRASCDRWAWADACAALSAADREAALAPEDLERLATALYLVGRLDASVEAWTRAHRDWTRMGDAPRAARCAFWLAFGLLNRGELAPASGWVERAQRLLEDELDCVERGYLGYCAGLRRVFEGDAAGAQRGFDDAAAVGERFHDPELLTLARVGQGRCLVYGGDIAAGMALIDEA